MIIPASCLRIAALWNGQPAGAAGEATVRFQADGHFLQVEIQASFHGDPAPCGPPGPRDRLWEHEVVELFLVGAAERYLELEMGPHGHYLVLSLAGIRQVVASHPADFCASINGSRWQGRLRLPAVLLPSGLAWANAFAIHGQGAGRQYLAAFPVPGPAPDFHRLHDFPLLATLGQPSPAAC
ncbi:MAG: hypothetical protein AB1634_10370 [Thermodesulfobacteriota bacterium]